MKTLLPLLAVITCALWVGAIAILAIQNYTSISLALFSLPLLKIPVGILLAFCAMAGMMAALLIQEELNRR